jgi:AcrR family transcriptional regulator
MSKKMGRPTLLNKHLKELGAKLARQRGMTLAKLAEQLGIGRTTLYYYLQSDKDFLNAINNGLQMADDLVEISLFQRAVGYSHPEEKIFQHEGHIIRAKTTKQYPPSEQAMMFWLKNRQPDRWSDKPTEDENKDIPIVIASDEQNL